MISTDLYIQDAVSVPVREDKPHRRLPLRVYIDGDCPGVVELTAKDGDREVLYAELTVRDLQMICRVAAAMGDESCAT